MSVGIFEVVYCNAVAAGAAQDVGGVLAANAARGTGRASTTVRVTRHDCDDVKFTVALKCGGGHLTRARRLFADQRGVRTRAVRRLGDLGQSTEPIEPHQVRPGVSTTTDSWQRSGANGHVSRIQPVYSWVRH